MSFTAILASNHHNNRFNRLALSHRCCSPGFEQLGIQAVHTCSTDCMLSGAACSPWVRPCVEQAGSGTTKHGSGWRLEAIRLEPV